MPNFLVNNNFYQGTSDACIVDLTPPTFAGINFLDVESRGQIRAGWSAASDPTPPIRYEVYIKASTATGLFNTTNIIAVTPNLLYDIFTLPDGSFLQNGVTYFVGVRAIDGVNNRDNNTVSQSVISTGVLTSIDVYETHAAWSIDENSDFRVTLWADKNESLAIAPSAVLGTASYEIYDSLGNLVVGMSGSGVSANAEGLFVFPTVTDLLDPLNEHYQIKATVNIDGEDRVNFIDIPSFEKKYIIEGIADVNSSGQVIGSFWASRNNQILTTNLGTGSFTAYDVEGNPLGISETGIVADGNGFFVITPFTFPFPLDASRGFVVRVSATVDGALQSQNLTFGNEPEVFAVKGVFSINALNQLEATFWSTKNNELVSGATLGTASYQIYDKNGVVVAGLNQTGITPDVNGYFHTTPVAATLLTDLTHYTAKITIEIAGQDRVSTKAFSLLGT